MDRSRLSDTEVEAFQVVRLGEGCGVIGRMPGDGARVEACARQSDAAFDGPDEIGFLDVGGAGGGDEECIPMVEMVDGLACEEGVAGKG